MSQIRLPFNSTAKMVFAVSDENGNILGLYRMPDATYFSIGVAVAKARNVAYYDNPSQLQPIDQIKGVAAGHGAHGPHLPLPILAVLPRGHRHQPVRPGLDPHRRRRDGISAQTRDRPCPPRISRASRATTHFNPNTNFHDPYNTANQNGVVLFPGSAPLYKDTNGGGLRNQLVGGLGVSGDGVLQDDDVTSVASQAYGPPRTIKRADQVKVAAFDCRTSSTTATRTCRSTDPNSRRRTSSRRCRRRRKKRSDRRRIVDGTYLETKR